MKQSIIKVLVQKLFDWVKKKLSVLNLNKTGLFEGSFFFFFWGGGSIFAPQPQLQN